jgi:hypothetical protein
LGKLRREEGTGQRRRTAEKGCQSTDSGDDEDDEDEDEELEELEEDEELALRSEDERTRTRKYI